MKKLTLLFCVAASMAFAQGVKVSDLPAATTLDGSELVPIVQGSTKKATVNQWSALFPLLSGTYNNPTWINQLAWSKITGTPTTLSGYGITAASGDYSAFYPLLSGTYNNPTWLNQLAWSKITGAPSFITLTGLSASSPLSYNNTTGAFSFPSWPANAAGVLQNNGSGTLSWASVGSTFTNGLTNTSGTVKLGGTLVENTNIDTDGFEWTLGEDASNKIRYSSMDGFDVFASGFDPTFFNVASGTIYGSVGSGYGSTINLNFVNAALSNDGSGSTGYKSDLTLSAVDMKSWFSSYSVTPNDSIYLKFQHEGPSYHVGAQLKHKRGSYESFLKLNSDLGNERTELFSGETANNSKLLLRPTTAQGAFLEFTESATDNSHIALNNGGVVELAGTTSGGYAQLDIDGTSGTIIGYADNLNLYNSSGSSHRFTVNNSGAIGVGSTASFGTSGQVLTSQGSGAAPIWTTVGGSGDVVGPSSAVNNRVVFFDGTTGKLIKDSGLTLSGSNTGDQTSIVGITGTLAQFNTAVTDADLARTDAANTFTGVQSMTSPDITASITTPSTTFSVANTTATTGNIFGAATTMNVGGTPTGAITHNYSTNATASGNTKTVNVGTGSAVGSTTNVNIGDADGGTTTIASPITTISGTLSMPGGTSSISSTNPLLVTVPNGSTTAFRLSDGTDFPFVLNTTDNRFETTYPLHNTTFTGTFNAADGSIAGADLADDGVSYAKLQNAGANEVLGRASNTSGDVSGIAIGTSQLFGRGATGDLTAITLGTNLTMSGTTLNASGGGGSTDLAFTGSSSPVTLTSSTGTDVTFTAGPNVTLSATSGNITINASGGGGSAHTIKDEGTPLTARSGLNFVGAGIAATDDSGNDETDITLDTDLNTIAGLSPTNDDFMQYKAGAWSNRTVALVKTDLGIITESTISPANITADQDNYNPTGWDDATVIRLTGDATMRAITSFAAPTDATKPHHKKLINVGDNPIYIPAEHPDGTAANRFYYYRDYMLLPKAVMEMEYSTTDSRWIPESDYDRMKSGKQVHYYIPVSSGTAADHSEANWIVSGTGAANTSTAASTTLPAGFVASTGTTATAHVIVTVPETANQFGAFGNTHMYVETMFSVPTLSDGTDTYNINVGLFNAPTSTTLEPNNSVFIRYAHATNGGRFELVSKDNAGATSTADTGITVAINTNYKIRIEFDKGRTEARAYINDAFVGRVAANMPNALAAGTRLMIQKTVGVTARSMRYTYVATGGYF